MKLLSLVTALVLSSSVYGKIDVRKNMGDHKVLSIPKEKWTHKLMRDLELQDFEVDPLGHEENSVVVKLSPGAHDSLAKKYDLDVQDITESWIEDMQRRMDQEDLFCIDGTEACSKRKLQDFYSDYQDLDAIHARIHDLVDSSSGLAKSVSIGKSYEGRDMRLIEIGDASKPCAFIFCNIHAREWLTPMFCSYLVETLLADGGHELLDDFSFAVVPSANPDGYNFSRTTNNMWRKTRMPNPGSNCVGTDGNRNWDNNHCGVGSSTNPCSETYCGASPFNQIEVANLNKYTLDNLERVMIMLDIHSYGYYIIHPYGYTEDLPEEKDYVRMRTCARKAKEAADAVNGDTWSYGTSPELLGYTSGGTSKDYFYGNLGIVYPYTVEVRGGGFQPSKDNIAICNQETFALVKAMVNCATDIEIDGNFPIPTVQPAPTPSPTCGFFFC